MKVTINMFSKSSRFQSVFEDLVTLAVLSFCVYIGRDSTFWTFITGSLFLLFVVVGANATINRAENKFDSKEDAIKYLNSQSDDKGEG